MKNYDLVDEKDLTTQESYHSQLLVCPSCSAIFRMKACGNRNLTAWGGFHPTDGNAKIVTKEFVRANEDWCDICHTKCNEQLIRVVTKEALDELIPEESRT